jgi:hypothetical protein
MINVSAPRTTTKQNLDLVKNGNLNDVMATIAIPFPTKLHLNYFSFSWSISASYFAFHGYAFTDFLEYPLLLFQNISLIVLHLRFRGIASTPTILSLIVAYLVIMFYGIKGPEWLLQILIVIF